MKLLILFWGRTGGGARYTYELAKSICKEKNTEVYMSLSKQNEYIDRLMELEAKGFFNIDTYRNIKELLVGSVLLPVKLLRLRRYIEEQGIDMILGSMDSLWFSAIANFLPSGNVIYVSTVHDAVRHEGENQWWRNLLLELDIRAAEALIVLSNNVYNKIVQKYNVSPQRIFVSRHGHFGDGGSVGSPRMYPENRPMRLLFFGRIEKYKGLDILLKAYILLYQQGIVAKLKIYGDGSLNSEDYLLKVCKNISIINRWIKKEEIAGIFNEADLIMIPYKGGSQSGVIATAYAYGLPCVCTPVEGISYQVIEDETGVVSKSFSPDDFADAIRSLIHNKSLYEEKSLNCISCSKEKYNWENIGAETVTWLQKIRGDVIAKRLR